MISHGEGFVLRHASGRYYRSELIHFGQRVSYAPGSYAVIHELVRNPFGAAVVYSAEIWRRQLESADWRSVADQFEVAPGPGCACCGARYGWIYGDGDQHRCEKHKDRNPCAVEGCKRTTSTDGHLASDNHLCAEHWRLACPPGSPERRVYRRLWRLHDKRDGKGQPWSPDLGRRFWRVWRRIVAIARARTAGDIDMDEINKLFGWE